jgi:hypothetical protein
MGARELGRVRKIALALPGVIEWRSHGAPCFFIRQRIPLCYYHDNHRGDGRISIWFPANPELQEAMLRINAKHFFRPAQSRSGVFSNWLGLFLDIPGKRDWAEVSHVLEQAYRAHAPKSLIAQLDSRF